MTGGWGTPKANPNRTQVDDAVKRIAAFEKERPDIMTGRCADDLHDECPGHLLGFPCSCDCHVTDDRVQQRHAHLAITVRMLPNGTSDESLAYEAQVCKGCKAILTEENTDDR